jgi:hypothetical protein
MPHSALTSIALGVLVVHLALVAVLLRWRWQRRERPPVAAKLLRAPGESLRHRLVGLRHRAFALMLLTTSVPVLLLIAGLALLGRSADDGQQLALVVATIVLPLIAAAAGVWLLLKVFNQCTHLRRQLQGERIVAETLATLVPEGYQVFHDVPTDGGTVDDNLNHVVIGPAGVFAVHTQTQARRKPLPGRKDHEIIFDGDQLLYPWGQDTQGIVPARDKAEWLSHWLFQILGERVPVSAVLTFPGWWVTPVTQRDVRVHNPGQIAALIQQSSSDKINPSQLELILRQLDIRCRDVES